ncbi:N-acetylmuramoyl-L-alanine amidase [Micromonospora sp. NPDC050187]|uniref:N-acetylmuramoyl-L-alanine amidase n=1 Tax=Micromonospora sp. NPDC050187 TaxID=3364277 RepID=UPI0037A9F3B3
MRVPGIRFVAGRNDYTDRDGRKFGVAIHNTSNDASAAGEASYATRRTDGVSAHFYVDDREVIQSIDTKHRTGHAGSSQGNDNAVSVEITGTNGKSRQWWLNNVAWDRLAQVLAVVCREYGIEPRRATVAEMKANPKVRAFYGHDDMRLAWGGTTHTDPGPNFPWDHLLAKVKQAMSKPKPAPAPAPQPEDEMEQNDRLVQRTDYPTRTVGHVLADVANLRNLLVSAPGSQDQYIKPAADSPLALLIDFVTLADKPLPEVASKLRTLFGEDRAAELGELLTTGTAPQD